MFRSALVNDGVRFIHLLSVAIGIGVSFLADAKVMRRLNAPLSSGFLATLHWCHVVVSYALVGMWLSGLALIYMRTRFMLENFNPKLIAKIVVVVLTLNSILIGKYAMGVMQAHIGTEPLYFSTRIKLPLAMISGVSTASWLLALALGSSAVLKTASAFLVLLPASYVASIVAAVGVVTILHLREQTDVFTQANAR